MEDFRTQIDARGIEMVGTLEKLCEQQPDNEMVVELITQLKDINVLLDGAFRYHHAMAARFGESARRVPRSRSRQRRQPQSSRRLCHLVLSKTLFFSVFLRTRTCWFVGALVLGPLDGQFVHVRAFVQTSCMYSSRTGRD